MDKNIQVDGWIKLDETRGVSLTVTSKVGTLLARVVMTPEEALCVGYQLIDRAGS